MLRLRPLPWAILLGLLCTCVPGLAQDNAHSVSITEARPLPGGDARLCVSVTDSAGRPVRGLGAANFTVTVPGANPQVTQVTPTDNGSPISIVVAVDVSRSLAGRPIAALREGAKSFVAHLGSKDTVCLVAFGEYVQVLSNYTDDKERLQSLIDQLGATGANTLLRDAIVECARKTATSPSSRTAVVLFTDGKDEGSGVTLPLAVAAADRCGAPFYTVGYGPRADIVTLKRISALAGGRFRTANSPEQTVSLYQDILRELKNQYVVTVRGPIGPGRHTIRTEVSLGGRISSAERDMSVPYPPEKSKAWLVVAVVLVGCCVLGLTIGLVKRSRRGLVRREVDGKGHIEVAEIKKQGDTGWQPSATVPIKASAKVWLEVATGPHSGRTLALTGAKVRIGRGAQMDLVLDRDEKVSRHHAEIAFNNAGEFVLSDVGSSGGTQVQGNDLGTKTVRLRDGDRIRLGATELVYRDERPSNRP